MENIRIVKKVVWVALVCVCCFLVIPITSNAAAKGRQKALSKAESYLKVGSYSLQGLQEQLKSDGFTKKEISYAIKNTKVNWKKQAEKKARSYLLADFYSKEELKGQLSFDKFTDKQVAYGLEHCGANWREQAKNKALYYLESKDYSKEELTNQLISDGFSAQQAESGAKKALSSTKAKKGSTKKNKKKK